MRLFTGRVQSGMETHIFQEICCKAFSHLFPMNGTSHSF